MYSFFYEVGDLFNESKACFTRVDTWIHDLPGNASSALSADQPAMQKAVLTTAKDTAWAWADNVSSYWTLPSSVKSEVEHKRRLEGTSIPAFREGQLPALIQGFVAGKLSNVGSKLGLIFLNKLGSVNTGSAFTVQVSNRCKIGPLELPSTKSVGASFGIAAVLIPVLIIARLCMAFGCACAMTGLPVETKPWQQRDPSASETLRRMTVSEKRKMDIQMRGLSATQTP